MRVQPFRSGSALLLMSRPVEQFIPTRLSIKGDEVTFGSSGPPPDDPVQSDATGQPEGADEVQEGIEEGDGLDFAGPLALTRESQQLLADLDEAGLAQRYLQFFTDARFVEEGGLTPRVIFMDFLNHNEPIRRRLERFTEMPEGTANEAYTNEQVASFMANRNLRRLNQFRQRFDQVMSRLPADDEEALNALQHNELLMQRVVMEFLPRIFELWPEPFLSNRLNPDSSPEELEDWMNAAGNHVQLAFRAGP